MSDKSQIEWTMATLNFLIGCTKKSAGCMNCYAIREAWRMMHNPNPKIARKYEGVVARGSNGEINWTGRINFDEDTLAMPLQWKKPRRIFVNSLSDFFHPSVKAEWILAALGVMMATPHHTYQILTKHPDRAARLFRDIDGISSQKELTPRELVEDAALSFVDACHLQADMSDVWPLPNVQILTSVEDQPTADERIPWLLRIPAAVRGISAEPLIGPILLDNGESSWLTCEGSESIEDSCVTYLEGGLEHFRGIDWVIVGGESGPKARPMHPEWARSLRDQCVAAGVPFFFKQWGNWAPPGDGRVEFGQRRPKDVYEFPQSGPMAGDSKIVYQIGKKRAGRLLDGCEWNEYPSGISNLEFGIAEGATA